MGIIDALIAAPASVWLEPLIPVGAISGLWFLTIVTYQLFKDCMAQYTVEGSYDPGANFAARLLNGDTGGLLRVMGGVFGVLILFGSYMAGVICLAEVQPASLTGISTVSSILGFLIVFRFNQVYVMFSKSRTHVGELLSSIRKVALHVNSMWRGNLSMDEKGRARTFKEVDRLYHHNHGSVHPEKTHVWMRQHGEDKIQKAADRLRRRGAASPRNRAGLE